MRVSFPLFFFRPSCVHIWGTARAHYEYSFALLGHRRRKDNEEGDVQYVECVFFLGRANRLVPREREEK